MLRVTKLLAPLAAMLVSGVVFAPTASANTVERSVFVVDERVIDSETCPFDIRVHLDGTFKNVDYYDNDGFLYRSIATPGGGGPFRVTNRANGVVLTQQSEAFSTVVTYRPDGSAATYTQRGPFDRYTVRGQGIVLLDTGTATWSEPLEELLFSGGPHQAVEGDFDAFCAAFG